MFFSTCIFMLVPKLMVLSVPYYSLDQFIKHVLCTHLISVGLPISSSSQLYTQNQNHLFPTSSLL
ncbi:hypothetical protein AAHE18_08G088700 [Arachis hypogaea]